MPDANEILIVGGYGVVGRRVAARLVPEFPDRVVSPAKTRLFLELLRRAAEA
jgi:hypothetical protein